MIELPELMSVHAHDLLYGDTLLETLLTASQNVRKALIGIVLSVNTQVTPEHHALGFTSPSTTIEYWNVSTGENETVTYPEWYKLDILRFSEKAKEEHNARLHANSQNT